MPKIIAVLSGKGGVGKSTISLLISKILSESSRTLILDFDLCGPSIAHALNVKGKIIKTSEGFLPLRVTDNMNDHMNDNINNNINDNINNINNSHSIFKKSLLLKESNNGAYLDVLSFGSILKDSDAVIWRGAKKTLFLEQMFNISNYDYVIIDTPPGISEEHLFLIDKIDSAVIVTTPQNMSLNDTQNCIEFCVEYEIKIAGIIENMSSFTCSSCSDTIYPFGRSGGELLAKEYEIDLIDSIPFDLKLGKIIDNGLFNEKYKETISYERLLKKIWMVT